MTFLFRLTPRGPFYLGNQQSLSETVPFPRSDTLFAALTTAWRSLWGDQALETLLTDFRQASSEEEIPFVFSSLFPVVSEIYFLPRPVFCQSQEIWQKLARRKDCLSPWVSARLFATLGRQEGESERLAFSLVSVYPGEAKELPRHRQWWYCAAEAKSNGGEHGPGRAVFYAPGVDWYLLARVRESSREKLAAALRLVAEEGIGARRSCGGGMFLYHPPTPLPASLAMVDEPRPGAFISLSLYYPALSDVSAGLLTHSAYQWIERGGWSTTSQGARFPQKHVRLFAEGSSFRYSHAPLATASLVETTPVGWPPGESPCYRYGYPFRVAISGEDHA